MRVRPSVLSLGVALVASACGLFPTEGKVSPLLLRKNAAGDSVTVTNVSSATYAVGFWNVDPALLPLMNLAACPSMPLAPQQSVTFAIPAVTYSVGVVACDYPSLDAATHQFLVVTRGN